MVDVEIKAIVSRLNPTCTRALERSAGMSVSRQHHEVTVEHMLYSLIEDPYSDVQSILRHFGIDPGRLQKALTNTLDRLRTGNQGRPVFSPDRSGLRARSRDPPAIDILARRSEEQPDRGRGRRASERPRSSRGSPCASPTGRRAGLPRADVDIYASISACLQAGAGVKGEFESRLKAGDRRGEGRLEESSSSSTRRTRSSARAPRPAAATRQPAQARARPRRAAHRSPRPRGPSTRSTSRRTPPSPAASSPSRSTSPPIEATPR
jgi:hypothetical protein